MGRPCGSIEGQRNLGMEGWQNTQKVPDHCDVTTVLKDPIIGNFLSYNVTTQKVEVFKLKYFSAKSKQATTTTVATVNSSSLRKSGGTNNKRRAS